MQKSYSKTKLDCGNTLLPIDIHLRRNKIWLTHYSS